MIRRRRARSQTPPGNEGKVALNEIANRYQLIAVRYSLLPTSPKLRLAVGELLLGKADQAPIAGLKNDRLRIGDGLAVLRPHGTHLVAE